MSESKITRTPSTEAVMVVVERLEDYLYWLRPGVRERAAPSMERVKAALAAMKDAGVSSPACVASGWVEDAETAAKTSKVGGWRSLEWAVKSSSARLEASLMQ